MHTSATASSPAPHNNIDLTNIFQYGSKATMEINYVFQKDYMSRQANNTYRFSVRCGPYSPAELYGFPIHKSDQHCNEMIMYKTLFPGHNVVYYFL